MRDEFLAFLKAIDTTLAAHAQQGECLDLYHIGRSALVLHYGLKLSTRDFDFVQMRTPLEEKAVELFGKWKPIGTITVAAAGVGSVAVMPPFGRDFGSFDLYLEPVPSGKPPVPQWFRSRCKRVPGDWQVIRLYQLDPHDLAATKLGSFRPQDRQDLQFMCDEGLLEPEELKKALDSAFTWTTDKDGDVYRDSAFENLKAVVDYLEGRRSTL